MTTMENLNKEGIKALLRKLKEWAESVFVNKEEAVFSVNEELPDEDGNVNIQRVEIADNLSTVFRQDSTGTFIQRASGGNAAVINGDARLISVYGNSVHENYSPDVINVSAYTESDEDPIVATLTSKETFLQKVDSSETITLTFTTDWNEDPAEYGITVDGTPVSGNTITIEYTKEVRGAIHTATPEIFVSTGWNLYDANNEYAKVVKYSNDYGYKVEGDYTSLSFATTPSGTPTPITPSSNGIFQIPSDGYVLVSGGNSSSTAIYATWADWTTGHTGAFEEYTTSVIDLTEAMSANIFPYGLCSVGNTRDEIAISQGRAFRRIDRYDYNDTNLRNAKTSGRSYEYDEEYIYIVRANPEITIISTSGTFVVSDHGIEYFTESMVPVMAQTNYNMNLKNKLERDTVTISQQTLSANEQAQVRKNIGASSNDDIASALATLNGSIIVKTYSFKTTAAINANAQKSFTAENFGIQEIEGYKIVHVNCRNTGHQYLHCYAQYPISSGTVIALRNNYTSNVASGKVIYIDVMYVKNQLVGG